jgi:hypothetical protein
LVVFVTLGIGALWEIVEFGFDQLPEVWIGETRWQGSPNMPPNTDTMVDLILGGVGGLVGALGGVWYVRRAEAPGHTREDELIAQITDQVK